MKLLNLMFLISSLALASNRAVVDKVLSTSFGKTETELARIYGAADKSNQQESTWKNKDYLFVWNKKRSLYYMEPRKLTIQELPFKNYKFERTSKNDQNLGGIVSVPEKGIYMTVDPDGNVSRVYWKSPWKQAGRKLSKSKVIELLSSAKAAK